MSKWFPPQPVRNQNTRVIVSLLITRPTWLDHLTSKWFLPRSTTKLSPKPKSQSTKERCSAWAVSHTFLKCFWFVVQYCREYFWANFFSKCKLSVLMTVFKHSGLCNDSMLMCRPTEWVECNSTKKVVKNDNVVIERNSFGMELGRMLRCLPKSFMTHATFMADDC